MAQLQVLGTVLRVPSQIRHMVGPIRTVALCLLAVFVLASFMAQSANAKPSLRKLKPHTIPIEFQPISGFDKVVRSKRMFGKLEWIGGGVLSAKSKYFGGWSGLALGGAGKRLVAVSDAGLWMMATLEYNNGKLSGASNARIGPLKALSGRVLRRGRERDAEAVALTSGTLRRGRVLIAFEQLHRIGTFRLGPNGLSPPQRYIKLPAKLRRIRSLKGFEAMTQLKGRRQGALLVIAERSLDRYGNHRGWLWQNGKPRLFTLKNIGGYDITDVAALDDGGIVVLERRFRWLEGVKMRVRHIAARELKPGALVQGDVLMTADLTKEIDNMEGLAIHKGSEGALILTMLSDDNFNRFLQRTVLLQFRWQRRPGKTARK